MNKRPQDIKKTGKKLDVIITHINADFDALGSMIAAKKLYPDATLVFPGAQEKNIRNFFLNSASYVFNFKKLKQVQMNRIRRLIIVDTRQRSRIGKFEELVNKEDLEIHIYDHHPESPDDIKGDVEVIEQVGATVTILSNIIRERGISITPDEATIMCAGIHEDTGSFTYSSTTPKDYMAAAWLSEQGANTNLISKMLSRELSAQQIWLLNDITRSATRHIINGVEVIITKVMSEDYIADFAVLVQKFMEMENLNVVFALAQMEDRIYLVARSRIKEVNVGDIAYALGGGGHPYAASATIKNRTLPQVEKELKEILNQKITPVKKAKDIMSSPVIHISPEASIKDAGILMTKYNINVLIITNDKERIEGYITRQVVEKAVFFGLGHIPVKEYMNIDCITVDPETPLKEVQDLIIREKLRILPVVENQKPIGVITRTDLLHILLGGESFPDYLYQAGPEEHLFRKKNVASLLKERLPENILKLLMEIGSVADNMGYGAYIVGGFVRDLLLRRDNLDIDIVIEGDGIRFAEEFEKQHNVRIRTHKKFGTAVIIFPDGFKVDIATARIEYYESPAATPVVETSSLKRDLFRRDFTINTLAIKLNKQDYGTLIDYFGGLRDLKEKIIRVLHNLSFVEDPTRVLRALRFEQRFGFRIGKLTQSLMKNAVMIDCFKDLSGRRLFMELKLLLMEDDPIKIIERMNEFDLLKVIWPEINYNNHFKRTLYSIQEVISWFKHLYLNIPVAVWKIYLYGLFSQLDTNALKGVSERLQMNDSESRSILEQKAQEKSLIYKLYRINEKDNYAIYRLLSDYDTEFLLYIMAKTQSNKIPRLISIYFTKLIGTEIELKGKDLIALGFEPGPIFKEIFDEVLKARLNGELSSKKDEIEFVKQKYQKSQGI